MKSRTACAIAFAVLVLAKVTVVGASSVGDNGGGLTGLVDEADFIFVGTVDKVESRYIDDRRSGIETLVTLVDLAPMLGKPEEPMVLRFSGGSLDGIREEFLGVPRFEPGERVVLFVRGGHRVSPVVGMSQGCFRVVEGSAGPVVQSSERRHILALPGGAAAGGGATGDTSGVGNEGMPLANFLDAIHRAVASSGRSGS